MPKIDASSVLGGGLVSAAPGSGGLVPASRPAVQSQAPGGPTIRAALNGHATPETAGSDFLVLDEPRKTTVGILFARDGDGKTYLCVNYCPEPVVVINLDGRGERAAKEAIRRGRKVFYLDASTPFNVMEMEHDEAMAAADASLKLITRNYEWAIRESIQKWGKGTLVIDTSTELRDIVRVAVRGRVDRPNPRTGDKSDYGKSDAVINRTMKYFGDRARASNLNLILLSRSKPVYAGREDTGRITWDTDRVFSQSADWMLEYRMVRGGLGFGMPGAGLVSGGLLGAPDAGVVGGGIVVPGAGMGMPGSAPTYEVVAAHPKLAHGETGAVYRQAEWEAAGVGPFAFVCSKVIPGSVPEDWQ